MKNLLLLVVLLTLTVNSVRSQQATQSGPKAPVKGFHLDLRIQVMTISALKDLAQKLQKQGINTLIMEWEATYPFEKHPMISNRYAYSRSDVTSFIAYCNSLGIDVIPLQQSFGHVEYILRNPRYTALREDQKDYSQVCPIESALNKALFTDLFTDLVATHSSPYFHIGGDETYLLGHCPKCQAKVAKEGKSKLFVDHIRMLCDIVTSLGKRPVLWADIALKHPEALSLLPKETILIDWNYGWAINRFGDPKKLVATGFEIWGAPSLRSHPDNYFLTQWEKHFKNIRDFVPTSRQMGYKGLVMTSWSTSGLYSPVFESSADIVDLYAIRHVYPLTGFTMLLAAYGQSLKTTQPLNIQQFVETYTQDTYGFTKDQAGQFWRALTTAPYEVTQGEVVSPKPMTIRTLLDSTRLAAKTLADLTPSRNKEEFEQYRLMTDVRVEYLTYQEIEKEVNAPSFTTAQIAPMLTRLKTLIVASEKTSNRFITLNKASFHPAELEQETYWRTVKPRLLYERLSKTKSRTPADFPQNSGK
ncbi:beta-N-acetylhexosaminidase [Spirosoma sp. KUDC1026]|uniref:beta-N-acetylhexosaminidase n=1 Tax=Spirosoma sp. KUDC1026 TaxID=2745947 RepID=UPI00159B9C41|nr:beta-N-acetylhexosaminidase [Spirosoma sp. KUDC1026]QKZ13281.1 beta-N-acetylhexosaminidase [Spirosoma sp. KUDC1026]